MPALAQDSSRVQQLDSIRIHAPSAEASSPVPRQILNRPLLQQLHPQSAGDAAKLFAGVLVRDYGGIGGLKTISVRNLGASHTGILYDGIPVTDAQSGQVDLGRISMRFVEQVTLTQAQENLPLQPARTFVSAAILSIQSVFSQPDSSSRLRWGAALDAGSFGWWKPSVFVKAPLGQRGSIGGALEYNRSRGNYPYTVSNGNQSSEAKRQNADIEAWQAALHFNQHFGDSSSWQTRIAWYSSDRGLPGALVFFNQQSKQRQTDQDFSVQSDYRKKLSRVIQLKIAAKYSYLYTRYIDSAFQNSAGKLDNNYRQQEAWLSAALWFRLSPHWRASWASDASYATLKSNTYQFAYPQRWSAWNAAGLHFTSAQWEANAVILHSYVHDKVKTGQRPGDQQAVSPTLAASWKPSANSDWMLRAFVKHSFRMPSFNDLYYVFAGNRRLRPEKAWQYNIGSTWQYSPLSTIGATLTADAYYNRVADKIIAVPGQNLFMWTMLNVGKTNIYGLDLTATIQQHWNSDWQSLLRLAYTLQQATDVSNPSATNYKDELPYTPRHSGAAFAGTSYRQWSIGWNSLLTGRRYVLGDNHPANQVKGWMIHDLSLRRNFAINKKTAGIGLYVNNVFNTPYDVIRYYPMPGRHYAIQFNIQQL